MTKMTLLKQNSELRADRIWNWTLPAWVTKLDDGRTVNVCPKASVCVGVCYARNGTYNFRNVKEAHQRNLKMVLDDLPAWTASMAAELSHKRFRPTGTPRLADRREQLQADGWTLNWLDTGGAAVRIHDAGDFFNDEYLLAWVQLANQFTDVLFYAYTKEVQRFTRLIENKAPDNFKWIYSMGGKEDKYIDKDLHRHAEVFPTKEHIAAAGYVDQSDNDLLAVLLPTTRIGVPANNIPAFKKIMNGKTFGELQQIRNRTMPDADA